VGRTVEHPMRRIGRERHDFGQWPGWNVAAHRTRARRDFRSDQRGLRRP
jgi:hypothetical protein